MFGRKSQSSEDRRNLDWPDYLRPDKAADIAWIKASGNPQLWHETALSCLIFCGDPHGFLPWLVRQPACDRVTAAAMFLHGSNGKRRLSGERINIVRLKETQTTIMIDRLCTRDLREGFPDHGCSLPSGWEEERLPVLAAIERHPRAPKRVLSAPVDQGTARSPYIDMGEGDLTLVGAFPRDYPYLFG